MLSKKSQGLSFSTIVLAVISIFILVLVILFVQGGLTGVRRVPRDISGDQISNARNACTAFCNEAQATVRTVQDFKNSRYCTKTFAINRAGDAVVRNLEPDGDIDDRRSSADPLERLWDDMVQCNNIDTGTQKVWSGYLGPCEVQLENGDTASYVDPYTGNGCPIL